MSLTLQTVTAAEQDQFRQNTAIRQIIEVLQISGLVTANAGQLSFPATQNPSTDANTLDDYEEGAWTPGVTFDTPGDLSVTYTTQTGRYTKIGRIVIIECLIITATFTHTTAASNMYVTGIPFAASSSVYFGLGFFNGITKAGYTHFGINAKANVLWPIIGSGSGVTASPVDVVSAPTGAALQLSFTGCYAV